MVTQLHREEPIYPLVRFSIENSVFCLQLAFSYNVKRFQLVIKLIDNGKPSCFQRKLIPQNQQILSEKPSSLCHQFEILKGYYINALEMHTRMLNSIKVKFYKYFASTFDNYLHSPKNIYLKSYSIIFQMYLNVKRKRSLEVLYQENCCQLVSHIRFFSLYFLSVSL